MQHCSIVLLEKLSPSELPVSTAGMSDFGSEPTTVLDLPGSPEVVMGVNLVIDPTFYSFNAIPSLLLALCHLISASWSSSYFSESLKIGYSLRT